MLRNVKDEFLKHIKGKGKVICASIHHGNKYDGYKKYILLPKHTKTEFVEFYISLDFEYHDKTWDMNILGLILFENNYSERRMLYGMEYWENYKAPTTEEVINFKP